MTRFSGTVFQVGVLIEPPDGLQRCDNSAKYQNYKQSASKSLNSGDNAQPACRVHVTIPDGQLSDDAKIEPGHRLSGTQ